MTYECLHIDKFQLGNISLLGPKEAPLPKQNKTKTKTNKQTNKKPKASTTTTATTKNPKWPYMPERPWRKLEKEDSWQELLF